MKKLWTIVVAICIFVIISQTYNHLMINKINREIQRYNSNVELELSALTHRIETLECKMQGKKIKVVKSTTWQDDSTHTVVYLTCTKCGAILYVTSKDNPSVVADWKVFHDCKK